MSNVPYHHQTAKEEIKTGKGMVGCFTVSSIICAVLAIYFLFDDKYGWGLSVILILVALFIHIPGILAGKSAIDEGKRKEGKGNTQ